jgi:hypothetical protein
MEIRPRSAAGGASPVTRKSKAASKSAADVAASPVASAPPLRRALEATPESRAAEVARARKLVADPAYPPPEVLKRVAGVLARHLKPEPPPE